MKKPLKKELQAYIDEKGYQMTADEFIDHHQSKGWLIGNSKTPMKDWKAAVRTWSKNIKPLPVKKDLKEMTRIELFNYRMKEVYAGKWRESEKGSMWESLISNLDNSQLVIGFEKCRKLSPDWPPTLFVFEEYCKGSLLHRTGAYTVYDPSRLLAVKKAKKETVVTELAKIKKIMKHFK